jgi:hypothetical protein
VDIHLSGGVNLTFSSAQPLRCTPVSDHPGFAAVDLAGIGGEDLVLHFGPNYSAPDTFMASAPQGDGGPPILSYKQFYGSAGTDELTSVSGKALSGTVDATLHDYAENPAPDVTITGRWACTLG